MPAKGSGKFGPNVIVGSPEYMKLWREENRDKLKQAQLKYRYKQRLAYTAMKLAAQEGISVKSAIAELEGKLAGLAELSADVSPVQVVEENTMEIPFVREKADEYDIPYNMALAIMEDCNETEWDAAFKRTQEQMHPKPESEDPPLK